MNDFLDGVARGVWWTFLAVLGYVIVFVAPWFVPATIGGLWLVIWAAERLGGDDL